MGMLFAGKALEWLAAKWMVPALVLGLLVVGGRFLEARRQALINQGEQKCEAAWQVASLKQQRDAAYSDLRAMTAQFNATDVLNMEIKSNAAEIERELAAARHSLAGVDERCLSDGVRDLARGIARGEGSRQPSSKSSPAAKGNQRGKAP